MEGISIAKLLVIGALIVLLFGTNKLRSLGGDLGAAIKGFKKAMNDDPASKPSAADDSAAMNDTHRKEP
ncbi:MULTISPECIES: twin-arginine translocase subunit TatE [unclassified Brenneria]|uniref:twin-arginine translocase subunit TatE n=1 Tax=unclassified Brenneria TaxID=2634434 RepID=UPI0015576E4B|nr:MULTISPECIES: twin-arginine translocase subunit TatE [unclassified Brenneria]MBJ7221711.1 twin-arginine translocase subunit TatE [Brenneria sp. L3-3C-1]MEE3642953.1 twin-arginine translocase subunit TatE [Brenneria sp. L3_3C_1]MEE3650861.1 twin-arginine translocase subunit TatE [Brenneria sp. HEZEL_4_2_4]NPD00817.1 twin-arginine translocase subunit TatE [Brenneria sp. hezel4-2-4]